MTRSDGLVSDTLPSYSVLHISSTVVAIFPGASTIEFPRSTGVHLLPYWNNGRCVMGLDTTPLCGRAKPKSGLGVSVSISDAVHRDEDLGHTWAAHLAARCPASRTDLTNNHPLLDAVLLTIRALDARDLQERSRQNDCHWIHRIGYVTGRVLANDDLPFHCALQGRRVAGILPCSISAAHVTASG
jgi:hypothetical protein